MKQDAELIPSSCIVGVIVFLAVSFLGSSNVFGKKRIFWIDSYQSGYEWSDGIERGIRTILAENDVTFGKYHMDTKTCKTPECIEITARKAKEAITEFDPDILIASDDNAQKYVVVPNYKNTSLPVVFCGVNWDASTYGYPAPNITGMVEVELVEETVKHMRRYAKGDRIGYISGKTVSDGKIISWLNRNFFDMKMASYQVADFTEFKEHFLKIQSETDMLFIRNYSGIKEWDPLAAKRFIGRNVKIPTGSNNDFMASYVIFTLGKIPEEQGKYAAKTALEVLKGTDPSELPITHNRQAKLTVNLAMAEAAGIVLPISILKLAKVIGQEEREHIRSSGKLDDFDFTKKKILWVDSYHKGYEWSDGIERGIQDILFDKGATVKIIRMNSKRENKAHQIKNSAAYAKDYFLEFQPDIVIASDDNAQKFFVVPYLKNSKIPVVFCGVNWDADMYGYPTANITGMVEVDRTIEMIALLKKYAKGSRVGYIGGNVATERKLINIYNKKFFQGRLVPYLVDTQEELEKQYIKAQKEVDILIFSNYTGIADWDAAATRRLVEHHTSIPTGSHNPFMDKYVVSTLAKSPEEQGRYAATTSLKVLSGTPVSAFPLTTNKQSTLTVNLKLAEKAGIVFPVSILKEANIIKSSVNQ